MTTPEDTMFALRYFTEPVEADDDIYTIAAFNTCVQLGSFIDYDGHGYFATATMRSKFIISPSAWRDAVPPEGATHVVWYNR
jgi:hypothetical protein